MDFVAVVEVVEDAGVASAACGFASSLDVSESSANSAVAVINPMPNTTKNLRRGIEFMILFPKQGRQGRAGARYCHGVHLSEVGKNIRHR